MRTGRWLVRKTCLPASLVANFLYNRGLAGAQQFGDGFAPNVHFARGLGPADLQLRGRGVIGQQEMAVPRPARSRRAAAS